MADAFFEIFIDVPIEECKKRDPKNLYKKAENGESEEEKTQNPLLIPSGIK